MFDRKKEKSLAVIIEAAKNMGEALIKNPKVAPPQSYEEAEHQRTVIVPLLYKLGFTSEAAELEQHVFEFTQPELHAQISAKLREMFGVDYLDRITAILLKQFELEHEDISRVYSRVKSTNSLWKKIDNIKLLKSITAEQFAELVHDFVAIRWNMKVQPGENRYDALMNGLRLVPATSAIHFRNQQLKQESGFSSEPIMKLYYVIDGLPVELQLLGGRIELYMSARGYANYKTGLVFPPQQLSLEQADARLGLCIHYAENDLQQSFHQLMLQELTSTKILDYSLEYRFVLSDEPNREENKLMQFADSEMPIYLLANVEFANKTLAFSAPKLRIK